MGGVRHLCGPLCEGAPAKRVGERDVILSEASGSGAFLSLSQLR